MGRREKARLPPSRGSQKEAVDSPVGQARKRRGSGRCSQDGPIGLVRGAGRQAGEHVGRDAGRLLRRFAGEWVGPGSGLRWVGDQEGSFLC